MQKVPLIHFKVPQTCVICGVREESSESLCRLDLNDFNPERLGRLPGKYLGQWVHRDPKCMNQILRITDPLP
jgi:hypothetical protein